MKNHLNILGLFILILSTIQYSCTEEKLSSFNKENSCIKEYKVSFLGNYAITKSASAFAAGVECSIFAYYTGENPSNKKNNPATPITAVSNLNGELIPNNHFTLYLAPGSYDFYAISTNSSTLNGLIFTDGESNRLKNGVDYLWAQSREVSIYNQTEIRLNFKHLAASISIEVNPLVEHQKIELTQARIGVPDSLQMITLASGKIEACNKVTIPKTEMNIDENRASYIVLPLQENIGVPIELYIIINSNNNLKRETKYSFSLPSPTNGFKGGTQYRYRVKVSSNKIIFESTSVESWEREEIENIYLSEIK